jgi:hypothetical protein
MIGPTPKLSVFVAISIEQFEQTLVISSRNVEHGIQTRIIRIRSDP